MTKKPKRLARGLVAVGAVKTPFSRSVFTRRGFQDDLVAYWPCIVGDMEAEWSMPERLSFPPGCRTGGTLLICVSSGSVAILLQYKIPLVIEAVNRYIGQGVVTSIRLRHGSLPPSRTPPVPTQEPALNHDETCQLQSTVQAVDYSPLQSALYRLGCHILKSDKTS